MCIDVRVSNYLSTWQSYCFKLWLPIHLQETFNMICFCIAGWFTYANQYKCRPELSKSIDPITLGWKFHDCKMDRTKVELQEYIKFHIFTLKMWWSWNYKDFPVSMFKDAQNVPPSTKFDWAYKISYKLSIVSLNSTNVFMIL